MLTVSMALQPITTPHPHTMAQQLSPQHMQTSPHYSSTTTSHSPTPSITITSTNTVMQDTRLDTALMDSTAHTYTCATVNKSRSTHTWHLKGFSHLPRSTSKPVTTTFQCGPIQWELRLFAYGENDDDQLSLFLHLKNAGSQQQVTCKFTFKLMATNSQHYCKGTNGRSFTFNKQKSAFGCPLLIHRQSLLSNEHLIHDDTLVVVTELEMATDLLIVDSAIQSPVTLTNNTTPAHLYQLSADMFNVINSKPDVSLLAKAPQTADATPKSAIRSLEADDTAIDQPVAVHRVILCARSPVFNAMLSKQFVESDQKTVVLHDINQFTLRKLVEYIYTGTLQPCTTMQWKHYVELYEAAVKYGVELLTELCAHHICLYINKDNIVQTLQLAESYKNAAGCNIIKHACKTKMITHFDDFISAFSSISQQQPVVQVTTSSSVSTTRSADALQLASVSGNDIFAPTPDNKKRRLRTADSVSQ